eukprot:106974-Hanusia_phi.AAC.1
MKQSDTRACRRSTTESRAQLSHRGRSLILTPGIKTVGTPGGAPARRAGRTVGTPTPIGPSGRGGEGVVLLSRNWRGHSRCCFTWLREVEGREEECVLKIDTREYDNAGRQT